MFRKLIILVHVVVSISFGAHATKRVADTEIHQENFVKQPGISTEPNNIDILSLNGLGLDPNLYRFGFILPFDLLCLIGSYLPKIYKNMSLVSKTFYLATRPVYHEQVVKLLVSKPDPTSIVYNRLDGKFGSLRDNIIIMCAVLSREKMTALMETLWKFYRKESVEEAYKLMKGIGRLEGILTGDMQSEIRKLATSDHKFLYDLYDWFCKRELNSLEEMGKLLNEFEWDINSKSVCLLNLLMNHVHCDAVKKLFADSIDPGMWSLISGWKTNSPIREIVKIFKSLDEGIQECLTRTPGYCKIPRELVWGSTFLHSLGEDCLEWCLDYLFTFLKVLLDESFCQKHHFTAEQCVKVMNDPVNEGGALRFITPQNCKSEWAKTVLRKYEELVGSKESQKCILNWLKLQHSVYDFERWESVTTQDAVCLTLKVDYLNKFLNQQEIEFILSKPVKVSEPKELKKWLPYIMLRPDVSDEEKTKQTDEAMTQNCHKQVLDLFLNDPKVVLQTVLAQVDQNGNFDPSICCIALHALVIMATTNNKYRVKHEKCLQKTTLVFCLKHFKMYLTEEQCVRAEQVIQNY